MTYKRIFIINGSGGTGKDTFVQLCSNHLKIRNTSKIIPAKRALCELLGVSMEWLEANKTEEIRRMLVKLNSMAIRHGDYPTRFVMEQVDEFLCSEQEQVMFIHIREPEEIDKVKNLINDKIAPMKVSTVLVVSDRVKQITSNPADANVLNYKYDVVIDNSQGIRHLSDEAGIFCTSLDES